MDCLFCKIAAGEIPSAKVYEDDRVLVFKDIIWWHQFICWRSPRSTSSWWYARDASNCELVGYIFTVIAKVAKEQGLTNGYRVVSNTGADGGRVFRICTSISWVETGLACLLSRLCQKNRTEKQQLPVQTSAWAALCFY